MCDIKKLKCTCCKCYDSFNGCTAWDCDVDFEISIAKVKDAAKEYGLSVDAIAAVLVANEEKRLAENSKESNADEDNILPEDFNLFYDSKFLIIFADAPGLGKRLLVEMSPDDLKRLRAEIDAALKVQGEN